MSLYREYLDGLSFTPAADREGVLAYRRADEPNAARIGFAIGGVVAFGLATGLGVAPRADWGAALFIGLIVAVFARAVFLAQHRLRHGGWQAWRARAVNTQALDIISGGGGAVLALLLATGAGGIGPAFAPGEAVVIGMLVVLASRAALLAARWP